MEQILGETTICWGCEKVITTSKDNYFEWLCESGNLCKECIKNGEPKIGK